MYYYRMIKSKVLRAVINQIPENVILKNVYLSYLIQKNFNIHWININFRKRLFGKTNYNFISLFSMIINLLIKLK